MGAAIVRGDASRLPLADASVDLIVTSPPYWSLRSYSDDGEHLDGQLGAEPSPQAYLEALWSVTAECWRVLKPTGSMFVNLGDKRSGSGAPGTTSGLSAKSALRGNGHVGGGPKAQRIERPVQGERSGKRGYNHDRSAEFGRPKSKMLLPHRYAIGCEDGLADPDGIGWIVRQDIVWDKPNGMPESVRDRTRDAHEYWFHLCNQGDYFAAIDEIREPHADGTAERYAAGYGDRSKTNGERVSSGYDLGGDWALNPLGKLPSSVWRIPTEPLKVPEHLEVDHFAAFPTEWPRRLILGFSPSGYCTACGRARSPIVSRTPMEWRPSPTIDGRSVEGSTRKPASGTMRSPPTSEITGYACACPAPDAPTRPSVILDPFGGTGTTAMVARALGRTGISIDLSRDYNRLARWRIFDSDGAAKVADRTGRDRQGTLL